MEDHNSQSDWVANRLALLDPPEDWAPNADEAYLAFRRARPRTRTTWKWVAAAAAVFLAAVALFPPARAVAQRILQSIMLNRLEVIRVDVDALPSDVQAALTPNIVTSPGNGQAAASAADASTTVGFQVRLPKAGILSGSPNLATVEGMTAQLDLNVSALRRGLEHAGAKDMHVPPDWNGARIVVFVNRFVIASWPEDITLIQSRPVSLSAPPNVHFPALAEIGLRIVGVGREPAKRLAVRMGENPGLVLAIPQDEGARIREVALRSGTGTLLHSLGDDGSLQRTELIWGTSDRLYALSGNITDELAIAIANSIE